MKIAFLNVKNVKKDTENFIKILEKYVSGVHFEKEVYQRYFSKAFFYLLGRVIPRNT